MNPHYFYWRFLFWPQLSGAIFLLLGFFAIRKDFPAKYGSLPILGRVFVPFALAVFGGEHMASAGFMKDMVPTWIPAHIFWIYFVGLAQFAAALSIIFRKRVELSASLLGFMFLTFVLTMHLPGAIEARNNRVIWTVVARDFFFALGAWTLAATTIVRRTPRAPGSSFAERAIFACRILGGLILLFFGVEQLLHPAVIPGVPLEALTPAWMPLKHTWGCVIGVLSLASGLTMLINRKAKCAAIALAIGVTIVVIAMNVPMLVKAVEPSEINLAVNYIGDSLLFAGMVLFFADAMPAPQARATAM
jgi:uncharacterized membrane protein